MTHKLSTETYTTYLNIQSNKATKHTCIERGGTRIIPRQYSTAVTGLRERPTPGDAQ